ncbi:type 2 isopentenyl-diphosphate Delta-isomerase [candidate division KSB1 bacterium]|nr:type 2 isopentenyl-diphosphate Delta-isomerase [candidate division KSB1 bacterium]
MNDPTNNRKIEHLRIVEQYPSIDREGRYFEDFQLRHRALPEIDLASVNTSTEFLGKNLSFPLIISSMTGGDHMLPQRINKNLATAAEKTQVAMAVGSQRVLFTHPNAINSFNLRQFAPSTVLCANIGAVQLNYGYNESHCQRAIDVLDADALYMHLNPLQEAIQPEGNTNFDGLVQKMASVASKLTRPVIIKEVGCGIGQIDAQLLFDHGFTFIDVAGAGGTSWGQIENYRRGKESGDSFINWGIPTPVLLQELEPLGSKMKIIASGGIRTGVDMAVAMILGASLCGIALPFLNAAKESEHKVVDKIQKLRKEFTITMFLLGITNVASLVGNRSLLLKEP